MKKIVSLLFICAAFVNSLSAQFPTGGAPGGGARRGGGGQMNIGRFYGRIIDKATNKGLEAASVQLIQNLFDTVTKKKSGRHHRRYAYQKQWRLQHREPAPVRTIQITDHSHWL